VKRRRWREPGEQFLETTVEIRVRFQEVDALGMVWHGHYVGYFETAREVFGERFGMEYKTLRERGVVAPIVHLDLDYFRPTTLGETIAVRVRLHPGPGAWLHHTYLVTGKDGEKLAEGLTIQALTENDGELCLTLPGFLEDWLASYQDRLQCEGSS